jgi:hypothetical protein
MMTPSSASASIRCGGVRGRRSRGEWRGGNSHEPRRYGSDAVGLLACTPPRPPGPGRWWQGADDGQSTTIVIDLIVAHGVGRWLGVGD